MQTKFPGGFDSTSHIKVKMFVKPLKILFIFLVLSVSTNLASSNDDNCRWIYRCCKKIRDTCVKICEPEIICEEETTSVQTPSGFLPIGIGFDTQQVILVSACVKGFKMSQGGKCRRIHRK